MRFRYARTISLNAAASLFCARRISSKSTSMPHQGKCRHPETLAPICKAYQQVDRLQGFGGKRKTTFGIPRSSCHDDESELRSDGQGRALSQNTLVGSFRVVTIISDGIQMCSHHGNYRSGRLLSGGMAAGERLPGAWNRAPGGAWGARPAGAEER